ncbi:MAG: MBL fold metallo-hydrolase [Candidatus Odinarchaeum yellowstonii]|uniref:MBL fold metallo-hydrolase n=1 Tax=Odinarchaeota yellowstonii (strain LCB_4) TaxID=1841599 RepID=A0AAF0D0X5_ODILC|nr:MAG: MBL fold metallo-hydrolase [Candidatus Odinarchaeum yellowstonii]
MGKITCLGACQEVGGSGFLVNANNRKILLDYGIYLRRKNPFPITVQPKEIDAIFLTHAHLDHSGALPLMYITGNPPIYTTKITMDVLRVLLEDYLNISEAILPYDEGEIESMRENFVKTSYGDIINVGEDFNVMIIDAGHIPGSYMALIEVTGKRILYTGDINIRDTLLVKGAKPNLPEIDYLIMESTYALTNHPPREELEKEFIESINQVVDKGGVVLIPAFALSRSQEVLCILKKYNFENQIILDGMAREISRIFLRYPKYFRDFKLLKDAHSQIEYIEGRKSREIAIKNGGVIIAPAGMLSGGAALYYARQLANDEKHGIFIVGYQLPGTPGRVLLDTGKLPVNGGVLDVQAQVKYFDFSAHAGSQELIEFIKSVPGNPTIIPVHGEPESVKYLADYASRELGLNTILPVSGETVEI